MATYIKTLKEDNGDITYPQTKASAVLLTNNSDLETELTKYVTAEDIASTSALTPPVQTNMIADGAVTDDKINWSTMTAYNSNSSTVALTTSNQTVLTVSLANFSNTDVLEFVVTVLAFGDASGNGLCVSVGSLECIQVGTWGRTCTFVGYNTKANLGSNLVVKARKDASYTLNKTFASAVVRRIG